MEHLPESFVKDAFRRCRDGFDGFHIDDTFDFCRDHIRDSNAERLSVVQGLPRRSLSSSLSTSFSLSAWRL